MPNTVRLKRSAVQNKVPLTTDLQLGELAVNTFDGKLYTLKNDGSNSVVEVNATNWMAPVKAATTANITLSGTQTIDGIALVAGDRALVKDQTTTSQNGVYIVSATAWTRAADADTAAKMAGAAVAVSSGTVNGGFTWDSDFKSTDTLGTTALTWARVVDTGLASSVAPNNIGTAASGTSVNYSRSDHVHDLPNTTVTAGSYTNASITVDEKGRLTAASNGGATIPPGSIVDADVSATAAIAGTKIAPNFGAQLIQSSQANQALSLTGILNPASTNNGLLSVGTLGFSGARMGANFTSAQTSYYQVVLQNTSNNAGASTDFVVCNDSSTDSTFYGNFGINSSTFSGTGALGTPSATYVTATSGPLAIGTTTANPIRFAYNGEATDSLAIDANNATFGKTIVPRTGIATAAPLDFTAGTNLTTPAAGAFEYDGTHFYGTATAGLGRGIVPTVLCYREPNARSILTSTISDFFSAGTISLAASSLYKIEFWAYWQCNAAGTMTFTLTASSAPSIISASYVGSPVTGIAAGAPTTGYTGSRAATTAAFAATASMSNNSYQAYRITAEVLTNLATTFRLRSTFSGSNMQVQVGSHMTVTQLSSATTGAFA